MGNGTEIPWDFESRDTNPGILNLTGLKYLWRLDLGQKSLGQSRDKNRWDSQIPSFETTWDSSWDNVGISVYDYGFDKNISQKKYKILNLHYMIFVFVCKVVKG